LFVGTKYGTLEVRSGKEEYKKKNGDRIKCIN
jgi:hypothetical protein